VELYEEFAGQRDEFEILAFHDSSAKSLDDLDEKLKSIVADVWGHPLPFPILLDASGETVAGWGINSYPTILLIDPEGRLLRDGDVEMLRKKLEETSAP
jgi:hypothetical protein